MRSIVRTTFIPFTIPLEGARPDHVGIPWMYQDVKTLVSTGLGNLIDPIGLALSIPFKRADGSRATRQEIIDEWHRIKNQPPDAKGRTAAMLGHLYAKKIATLHLTNDDILDLIRMRLESNESIIASTFPRWEEWSADAQLATHSMAWACGAGIFSPRSGKFHWPKLTAALHAFDYMTAARECFMPEEAKIGGLRPRNKANRIMYTNASIVLERAMDPDVLHFPADLDALGKNEPAVFDVEEEFRKIPPDVPLGRPALDGDLPDSPPEE